MKCKSILCILLILGFVLCCNFVSANENITSQENLATNDLSNFEVDRPVSINVEKDVSYYGRDYVDLNEEVPSSNSEENNFKHVNNKFYDNKDSDLLSSNSLDETGQDSILGGGAPSIFHLYVEKKWENNDPGSINSIEVQVLKKYFSSPDYKDDDLVPSDDFVIIDNYRYRIIETVNISKQNNWKHHFPLMDYDGWYEVDDDYAIIEDEYGRPIVDYNFFLVREVNIPNNVNHISTLMVSSSSEIAGIWPYAYVTWDILNNVTVDEPSENSSDSFNGSSRVVVEKRWVNGDSGNVSSVDVELLVLADDSSGVLVNVGGVDRYYRVVDRVSLNKSNDWSHTFVIEWADGSFASDVDIADYLYMHIVREVNVPGNVRHVSTSLVRNVSTKTNQSFVWEFYWDILNNVTNTTKPPENKTEPPKNISKPPTNETINPPKNKTTHSNESDVPNTKISKNQKSVSKNNVKQVLNRNDTGNPLFILLLSLIIIPLRRRKL